MKKNETGPLSYHTQKTNSKWTEDLNVRPETIKLLEENMDREHLDIVLGDYFSESDAKATATTAEINKWDNIKLKIFSTAKGTTNKMRRQPTEWEEVFADHFPTGAGAGSHRFRMCAGDQQDLPSCAASGLAPAVGTAPLH